MLPVAMVVIWGAYAVGSWGYCLLRGYDVSFRSWVSPLHPYAGPWPPALIPTGKLWPQSAATVATQTQTTAKPVTEPGGNA